jgi:hypothetical protein
MYVVCGSVLRLRLPSRPHQVPAFIYHIIHPGQIFTISGGSCNVVVVPITGMAPRVDSCLC